jgi:hypothetical protein
MSIAQRQPRVANRAAQATREVVVRWRVAARAFEPGARGGAGLEITAQRDDDGTVRIEAAVVSTAGRKVVRKTGPLPSTAWWMDADGLEHLEAAPTLRATVRDGVVLFAQTDVLAELGLAGGRYDRPA